jgi:tetratricopeptide (TPR) repeat protein
MAMKPSRVTLSCAVAALSLFVLPSLGAAQSRGSRDARASLSGKVLLEGQNGAPSQLRVELRMLADNQSVTALTDQDGNFHLEAIPAGTYFVTVAAPGCIPFEETLQVEPSTAPLLIRLRKNNSVTDSAASSISVRQLSIPEKARKFFEKGNHLLAANNPAEGISEYRRAIKVFPDYYEAYYKIGVAELHQEHGAEAEAAFRKAAELSDHRYAPALSGLSLVLCIERRFVEAESAARENLQLDATDATGHYALGLVAYVTGHMLEAENDAVQALRYKPAFLEAYLLLAQVHARQNNPAAVVADLDAYLQLDPSSPRAAKARTVRAGAESALLRQATGAAVAKADP